MNKKIIRSIFTQLAKQNPTPVTELIYNSTFELLIAVILSAQTTDVAVNKITQQLFHIANTPASFIDMGEIELKTRIKSIGLYNAKATNIIRTCEILINKHQGQVPNTRVALEALPGVGRKTANVILNTAFSQDTLAVDTHVFRVARRLGLAHKNTPLAVEQELLTNIPQEFIKNAHHWLVLHGRYVCTARRPHCCECILAAWCKSCECKNLELLSN